MWTLEKTDEVETMLPAGFTARPAAISDVEEVVALLNAAGEKLIGSGSKFTTTMYQNSWTAPGFNMETDTRIVIAPDAKIAGYYEVNDHEPHVTLNCWGRVHPTHENQGVGTYLLNWADPRRQAIPHAPEDARVTMLCFVISLNTPAAKLFEDFGMSMIRHNLRMVIDLNEQPPASQLPEGITIRTMVRPDDDRAVLQAVRDSFRDHWGFVETPFFEHELVEFKHYMDSEEHFDPSLQFLAMAGDQIVGVSLCAPRTGDDPKMGWVNTLGVVREWRRQGVALALLHHTFSEFYKRGLRKVGLGVDAQSLTGATKLYERAGMHPDPLRQYSNYEKELRAGKDLSVQSL